MLKWKVIKIILCHFLFSYIVREGAGGRRRGGGGAVCGDLNQRHETLLMMHPYHFLSCIVYGVYVFVVTLEMSLILLYSRHYLGHNYGSCSNFHFSTRKKKKKMKCSHQILMIFLISWDLTVKFVLSEIKFWLA